MVDIRARRRLNELSEEERNGPFRDVARELTDGAWALFKVWRDRLGAPLTGDFAEILADAMHTIDNVRHRAYAEDELGYESTVIHSLLVDIPVGRLTDVIFDLGSIHGGHFIYPGYGLLVMNFDWLTPKLARDLGFEMGIEEAPAAEELAAAVAQAPEIAASQAEEAAQAPAVEEPAAAAPSETLSPALTPEPLAENQGRIFLRLMRELYYVEDYEEDTLLKTFQTGTPKIRARIIGVLGDGRISVEARKKLAEAMKHSKFVYLANEEFWFNPTSVANLTDVLLALAAFGYRSPDYEIFKMLDNTPTETFQNRMALLGRLVRGEMNGLPNELDTLGAEIGLTPEASIKLFGVASDFGYQKVGSAPTTTAAPAVSGTELAAAQHRTESEMEEAAAVVKRLSSVLNPEQLLAIQERDYRLLTADFRTGTSISMRQLREAPITRARIIGVLRDRRIPVEVRERFVYLMSYYKLTDVANESFWSDPNAATNLRVMALAIEKMIKPNQRVDLYKISDILKKPLLEETRIYMEILSVLVRGEMSDRPNDLAKVANELRLTRAEATDLFGIARAPALSGPTGEVTTPSGPTDEVATPFGSASEVMPSSPQEPTPSGSASEIVPSSPQEPAPSGPAGEITPPSPQQPTITPPLKPGQGAPSGGGVADKGPMAAPAKQPVFNREANQFQADR
ncbi:MAG: hypothetical protein HY610_00185, partial [Elusimicrobia bacterium]|nr:hypothetical protein [Elusimicrobiota bacterium]